jgi:hypothetical protein
MPNRSGARFYCPACNREGASINRYNHSNSKMHRRNTERLFPRPDLPPVDPLTLARMNNFPRGKPAHLGYLIHPASKTKS